MTTRRLSIMMALGALFSLSPLVCAGPDGSSDTAGDARSGGVAWYGTWKQAQAVAQRTGRPILLLSAAPHCRNVSGQW